MSTVNTKVKVTHLITDLEYGGAENMLCKLVQNIPRKHIDCSIVSLTTIGPIGEILRNEGLLVESIGAMPGKIPTLRQTVRLFQVIYRIKPNIIQGWMYHGNLAATMIGALCTFRPRVVWNIRQSLGALRNERLLTRGIIRFSALISRLPHTIIYNSRESIEKHEAIGFCRSRSCFVANGFSLQEYSPEKADVQKLRHELDLDEDTCIVTHVARYHSKKDHKTFFEAANLVLQRHRDVKFVAVGRQVIPGNRELWAKVKFLNLERYIDLLGERRDVPQILASSDLFVSSSAWGEGFPNTIGEAMASGTPCVVTDVGESAFIVGETGFVVEPQNPSILANAILGFIEMIPNHRRDLGIKARKRIQENYSIEKIAEEYLSMYSERELDKSHLNR